MTITDDELVEITRRSEAACPLPWRASIEGRDHVSGSHVILTGTDAAPGPAIELMGGTAADHDFVAHARADVPRLVEEVRCMRALLAGSTTPRKP